MVYPKDYGVVLQVRSSDDVRNTVWRDLPVDRDEVRSNNRGGFSLRRVRSTPVIMANGQSGFEIIDPATRDRVYLALADSTMRYWDAWRVCQVFVELKSFQLDSKSNTISDVVAAVSGSYDQDVLSRLAYYLGKPRSSLTDFLEGIRTSNPTPADQAGILERLRSLTDNNEGYEDCLAEVAMGLR